MHICKACGEPKQRHSIWTWNVHRQMVKAAKVAKAMRKAGIIQCTRLAR